MQISIYKCLMRIIILFLISFKVALENFIRWKILGIKRTSTGDPNTGLTPSYSAFIALKDGRLANGSRSGARLMIMIQHISLYHVSGLISRHVNRKIMMNKDL